MRWIKVTQKEKIRMLISLALYTFIYSVVQSLRGFTFHFDDLIKRVVFNGISVFIAFSITFQFSHWLDTFYDWNYSPKRRLIVESILKILSIAGIIILLHITLSYIFIALTLNISTYPNIEKPENSLLHYFFGNYTFIILFDVFIMFCVWAVVIELFVLFDFSSYLIQKWNTAKIEKEAFEKEKAQFSLDLLRTQINPHFLFNNLNTLSSLIYIDQDKAADFLRKLSGVYRNILEHRNKETITLEEELTFFNGYADLLQVRFANMLFFDIQIDKEAQNKKIIPLTLQMLIENAIKHNIVSASKPLYIKIKTDKTNLIVSNNLQIKATKEYSSGLGLTMISNRYEYISDKKIVINKTDSIFSISVPLIN